MILKILTNNIFLVLLSAVIAFFAPIQGLIIAIVVLCLADAITAIMRDWKKNSDKYSGFKKLKIIKSRKLRRTVTKIVLYVLFICLLYLLPVVCFHYHMYAAHVVVMLFGAVEIKSIAENLDFLTGQDLFTSAFSRVRKLFENKINEKIEKPE